MSEGRSPERMSCASAQGHMLWTELVMRSGTNLFVPGHMPDAHHERRAKPGANELCAAQVTCMGKIVKKRIGAIAI